MNLIDIVTFKVILDYGHNVPAINDLGAALASVYDHIILADIDPRNRVLGKTPELVKSGALKTGFSEMEIEIIIDPLQAIDCAFSIVQPGDLIMVQVDEVAPML